jgi:hypothetical protein
MVNGRIAVEQMEWLQARADQLDGNLSGTSGHCEGTRRNYRKARDAFFPRPRVA